MFLARWLIPSLVGGGILLGLSPIPVAAQDSALRERILQNHLRFIPEGSGPFPTLVAIPGCSGIAFADPAEEATHPELREDDRLFRAHYPRQAERLRGEGFAVLLLHIHAGEDLVTACGGQIEPERIAQYIEEAVAWASELDFVDPARLHLIGWSMGGRGVLRWLHRPSNQSSRVRSAIAVYAGCSAQEPLMTRLPLLMLLGGADDIADPSECEELVARSNVGAIVSVHNYPGARHGYDIPDAPAVMDIGNGMTIGYQQAAAEASWREILAFLAVGR